MNLLTVAGGTVHTPDCPTGKRASTWPWQPRNDGPGVAHACARCLPDGLPEPCLACDNPVDRTLPDPIPDGRELMGTEALAGRALYCAECYEEQPRSET